MKTNSYLRKKWEKGCTSSPKCHNQTFVVEFIPVDVERTTSNSRSQRPKTDVVHDQVLATFYERERDQPISEAAGPSNSKRKVKDKVAAPSKRSAKNNVVASSSINQPFVPSRALIDEGELDDEDDQPILRPKVISEAKTRLKLKKLHQQPTGARKDCLQGR
ncbi:hypothetical protein RND71_015643 [Anisodus tanguticus]|uniref:Uncharacterized protein n=1 Tax=Anisodus tanguticus TaxID=243964 RepID=A0AAE1VLA2_9SOLA|nr:hypothetical protein RND71_015643 [Anisodus tanguticus]